MHSINLQRHATGEDDDTAAFARSFRAEGIMSQYEPVHILVVARHPIFVVVIRKPFSEVEMVAHQTHSSADRLTRPLLKELGAIPAAA